MEKSTTKGIDQISTYNQDIDNMLIKKIFDTVAHFFGSISGWGMVLISITMIYEIIMRYLGSPTTWVNEISGYSMIWFTFFSAAYVLQTGAHIQVDVLILRLCPRTRNMLDIFNYMLISVYVFFILYYSWMDFVYAFEIGERTSTMLRLHTGWLYGGIIVGCLLLLSQSLILLVKAIVQAFVNRLKGGTHLLDNLLVLFPGYFVLILTSAWLFVRYPIVGAMAIMLTIMVGGVPIFAALGVVGSFGLYFLLGADTGLAQISGIALKSLDNFTLLAIPLYVIGGKILVSGGVGKELFKVCTALIGHLPGGAMIATIGSCAIFAAISGSSVATAATIGMIAIPEMLKRGYKSEHALGVVAAGGTLGIVIPPSAPLIIYSTLTEESTGALFMGGVFPGIFLALLFCLFAIVISFRSGHYEKIAKTSWMEKMVAIKDSFWGIMAPVIVISGIYLGILTPTEAAAVIVGYALAVSLIRKKIKISDLNAIFKEGTSSASMIMMIVFGAMIVGTIITFLQVPQDVCSFASSLTWPPWAILLGLCIIYIVLGCFLEVVSILMITTPIVYPLVTQLGYNGLWFGVFLVLLMEIALITPPLGLNLYVILSISRYSIETVIKGVWPYIIILFLGLLSLYFWPEIILWLPDTMGLAGGN